MKTFWKTFLIPSQQVFVVLNHCKNPINLRNVSKRAKRAKKRQRTKKRRKAKKQIGKTTSRDRTRRIIHVASGTVGPVGGGGVDELELNVLFLLLWAWSAGTQLLALWPVGSDKRSGHVPKAGRHRHGHQAALLSVELPERDARFPAVDAAASASASQPRRELASLDDRTQQTLLDAVRGGSFAVMDLYRREVRCLSLVWSPFQSLIVFFRSLFFSTIAVVVGEAALPDGGVGGAGADSAGGAVVGLGQSGRPVLAAGTLDAAVAAGGAAAAAALAARRARPPARRRLAAAHRRRRAARLPAAAHRGPQTGNARPLAADALPPRALAPSAAGGHSFRRPSGR